MQLKTVMSDPGYVKIPLNAVDKSVTSFGQQTAAAAATAEAGASPRRPADPWKFGRSANKKFLSPVAVSRTMHMLLQRVATSSIDTENEFRLLPFAMETNRSPIVGWLFELLLLLLRRRVEGSQQNCAHLEMPACELLEFSSGCLNKLC